MPEHRPSTATLVAALKAATGTFGTPTHQQREILAKASAGHYHEFFGPLATPLIQLVADLRRAGWPDIAERAIQGEFDSTREEYEAWKNSAEAQQAFRDLFGGEQ